jgi:hypothetical protein
MQTVYEAVCQQRGLPVCTYPFHTRKEEKTRCQEVCGMCLMASDIRQAANAADAHHSRPRSPPPRTCATPKMKPRSSKARRLLLKYTSFEISYAPCNIATAAVNRHVAAAMRQPLTCSALLYQAMQVQKIVYRLLRGYDQELPT